MTDEETVEYAEAYQEIIERFQSSVEKARPTITAHSVLRDFTADIVAEQGAFLREWIGGIEDEVGELGELLQRQALALVSLMGAASTTALGVALAAATLSDAPEAERKALAARIHETHAQTDAAIAGVVQALSEEPNVEEDEDTGENGAAKPVANAEGVVA